MELRYETPLRPEPPRDHCGVRCYRCSPEVLFDNLPNQFRDPESIAAEVRTATRPWPFALDEISVPTIIWQAGRDDVHTPAMARHLADQIPDARLEFEPGYATFNFFDGLDNILTALTE